MGEKLFDESPSTRGSAGKPFILDISTLWGTTGNGLRSCLIIYINDITRNLTSQCKLFADDMKVNKVLRNTNEDMHVLQEDLYSLECTEY